MGMDIKCVLQKNTPNGKWVTIDQNCFDGRRIPPLFNYLEEFLLRGLPRDFVLSDLKDENGEAFYLGEPQYQGWLTLQEFCQEHLNTSNTDIYANFVLEKDRHGLLLRFPDRYETEEDMILYYFALTFSHMFDNLDTYRLIFGFH